MEFITYNVYNFYQKFETSIDIPPRLGKESLDYFGMHVGRLTLPIGKHEDIEYIKSLCHKTLSYHHWSNDRKRYVTKLRFGLSAETWHLYWDYAEAFFGFCPGDYIKEKFAPKGLVPKEDRWWLSMTS